MAEQEIISPPWPGDGTNAELLYQRLLELRDWVNQYRDGLNEQVGQDLIPATRKPPKAAVYTMQPVEMQHRHYQIMRLIRSQWDQLVRDYEDEWDSRWRVQRHIMLVQAAVQMFNDAFTSFEVQEARAHEEQDKMQRSFERLREVMTKIVEDPESFFRNNPPSPGGSTP